ncbi:MAG: HEAT repeat domain-containing protein, partial [Planctomycetota bacterium]
MSRRRLAALVLLALLTSTASSEEDSKPAAGEIEVAKRELQTTDLDRLQHRFNAAEVAARSGDAGFVPLLFQAAVSCKTPALAVAAGEAANKLDPKEALKLYDAGKGRRRGLAAANAVRFLGEIRARGAGTRLADAAKAQNIQTRVEALYGIVKQQDPALHIHLTAALKMRDAEVRVPAAICCGLAKAAGAVELLLRGLDKPDDDYAYFCAWALGQMEDPGVLPKVLNTTKGRMAGAAGVAKAKAILECAKDPQHIELLLPLTRASNEDVAGAACTALGSLAKGHPEATDALLAVVNRGTRSPLSHLAADALGRTGGVEHGKKLTARYKNNPGKIQTHAVRALGLLKDPGAAPLLLQLAFRSKSIAIQKRAAFAFWQCADEEARTNFRKKLLATSQGRGVALGCAVLGFNRSKE